MVTAALICFAVLLIAWIAAPERGPAETSAAAPAAPREAELATAA